MHKGLNALFHAAGPFRSWLKPPELLVCEDVVVAVMQASEGEIQKRSRPLGLSGPVAIVKVQSDVGAHMLQENWHQSSRPDMGCGRETRELTHNLSCQYGLHFKLCVVGGKGGGHLSMLEFSIHGQVPWRYPPIRGLVISQGMTDTR